MSDTTDSGKGMAMDVLDTDSSYQSGTEASYHKATGSDGTELSYQKDSDSSATDPPPQQPTTGSKGAQPTTGSKGADPSRQKGADPPAAKKVNFQKAAEGKDGAGHFVRVALPPPLQYDPSHFTKPGMAAEKVVLDLPPECPHCQDYRERPCGLHIMWWIILGVAGMLSVALLIGLSVGLSAGKNNGGGGSSGNQNGAAPGAPGLNTTASSNGTQTAPPPPDPTTWGIVGQYTTCPIRVTTCPKSCRGSGTPGRFTGVPMAIVPYTEIIPVPDDFDLGELCCAKCRVTGDCVYWQDLVTGCALFDVAACDATDSFTAFANSTEGSVGRLCK